MFILPPIWEPTERWVRATFGGATVAASRRAMLMVETDREMDYYFPLADVREELLVPSAHLTTSPTRGTRRFWHVVAGGKTAENAAWTYDPLPGRPDFGGHIALVWAAMDHWYEESEEVYLEPRNPYHRVDFIPGHRHVRVQVNGTTVADTRSPLLVFETYTPVRFYFPPVDVDHRFLQPTNLHTRCQYKGRASYYSLKVKGESYENAAWYYPEPLPEAPRVKDLIAFWPEKDPRIQIIVDGEPYSRRLK